MIIDPIGKVIKMKFFFFPFLYSILCSNLPDLKSTRLSLAEWSLLLAVRVPFCILLCEASP